jgi:hypothetical protein
MFNIKTLELTCENLDLTQHKKRFDHDRIKLHDLNIKNGNLTIRKWIQPMKTVILANKKCGVNQ